MSTYRLICPFCGTVVELPDDEPDDPLKVVGCSECVLVFDYGPLDVHQTPRQLSH
jgi:hypothetical protein